MTSVVGSAIGLDGGLHHAPEGALARLRLLSDGARTRVLDAAESVVAAEISIEGVAVTALATDGSVRGGALGSVDCAVVVGAVDRAVAAGTPLVAVWHCAGARIDGGVFSLDGMGSVFAAFTRASGTVPQISLVLGTSAGGAAYGASLTDIVVAGPAGRLFVTGPGVIAEVTGEVVTPQHLGGPDVHSRRSGVVHVAADSESAAVQAVRDVVALLGRPPSASAPPARDDRFGRVLPERPRETYDVRAVVDLLLDGSEPSVELHRQWAPNVVTVLGRLDGRTVGVLANNPCWLAGCLDAQASDKAARFVQMCDSFGVPLVVLVDVPGYLPGVQQEWDGVLRRGAKLLHAFAASSVPRVTVHLRKAYGGAYIAMNSRSLGASTVLAWPTAEIAVMGPEAAVRVVHRRALEQTPPAARQALEQELVQSIPRDGLRQAVAAGLVDRVIDPGMTAVEVARALSAAAPGRGRRGNIPL